MYSKDTAPSNEEQQSRRDEAAEEEGGRGGLCTERRGLGLRVSQRPSNQTSAPGVSALAKCK